MPELAEGLQQAARLQAQFLGSGIVLMVASVVIALLLSAFGRK